jgi:branched-chain amino acid transport system substrate-binding protein
MCFLLPGVRVNTSSTNHHPLQQMQMQLQRWEGQGYVLE